MQTKRRDLFTTVRTEGAILPADLLQRIADGDRRLEGLTPDDFHRAGERLNEVINAAWNRLLGQWQTFQGALAKLPESDPVTSATRERWLLPLFREFDYGRLTAATSVEIDGKSYPVSHAWQKTPLHLVGWRIDLDRRTAVVAGAARTSPHSMVQVLLNRSDDRLWGFASNGRRLRILRDNVSLTRQAFVEFDLEAMLDGEVYADFALLWLLCHQSRVEGDRPEQCWLEKWSRSAQQTGTRALDTLRKGVEDAIVALGRGFVAQPANGALREKLRLGGADGGLSAQDYYRQILRLVYRLLFLFVSEDRGLLLVPGADEPTRERFARFYSTARLRHLAERHRGTRHCDLFQGVALVMQRLGTADGCPELGLPALGSFLWSDKATPDLLPSPSGRGAGGEGPCRIANSDLLAAIRALAFTIDGNVLRAVDYRNLGAEELGSVYESLLELHPKIHADAGEFELDVAAGHERKTTGSYYTPTSLINCLLDSALDPVVDDRLKEADRLAAGKWKTEAEQRESLQIVCRVPLDGSPIRPPASASAPEPAPAQLAAEATAAYIAARTPQWDKTPPAVRYTRLAEQALLTMKICDPACGSGHFLIAAAHRQAKRLAAVRTGDEEPAPDAVRHALRDVISHCIYGVDINPMAVELCKINLWLESLEPGKPLSFLDHHIQCGNSLLGATPALLAGGIPDDAFKPIEGDDKTVCSQLKKENKRERQDYASGQGYLFDPPIMRGNIAAEFSKLTAASEDTAQDVASKEARYARLVRRADYETARLWADAWCSVFVWKKDKFDLGRLCPTERKFRDIERNPHNVLPAVRTEIKHLGVQYQFFHWHLAFPDVFRLPVVHEEPENEHDGWSGGFHLVLGNPPWDTLSPDAKEFFAAYDPQVRFQDRAGQKQIIEGLLREPVVASRWEAICRHLYAIVLFIKQSGRYRMFAPGNLGKGDFNVYRMFVETALSHARQRGWAAQVVPEGLYNGANCMAIRKSLFEECRLVSVIGFENANENWFTNIDTRMKFCIYVAQAGQRTESIDVAFNVRSLERLAEVMAGDVLHLPVALVPEFSPDALAIMELGSQGDIDIAARMYRWPASGNKTAGPPIPNCLAEVHMGNNRDLFEEDATGIPLCEGRMVAQYDHRAKAYIAGRGRAAKWKELPFGSTEKRIKPQWYISRSNVPSKLAPRVVSFRSCFCNVGSPTNERTLIATLIPPNILCGDSVPTILFEPKGFDWFHPFWIAIANTYAMDFLVRTKVALHLTMTVIYSLPFPRPDAGDPRVRRLVPLSLQLICTCPEMVAFWNQMAAEGWVNAATEASIPGVVDEEKRLRIRAEIDVIVAHDSFDLTRGEVEYILDTFPTQQRYQEQKYGEFRSRRLILEIYDAMAESMRSGRPYQTLLDPPPGPPADCLPDWPPNQPRPANWPSHIHPPRHTEGR